MAEVNEQTALLAPPPAPVSGEPESSSGYIRRHSVNGQPPYHEEFPETDHPSSTWTIVTVISVLILGVFVANGDGSLVVASSQKIASEFNSLSEASWLVSSYVLAQCASQPLYGKLSDIFGRKANLTVANTLFAVGCLICGVGQSFWIVLAGRAISGVGGAGMTALVSITIADMVPVRNIASWLSYVNIAATLGRSLGGPIGGLLADTVGWRWSFIGQAPLTGLGLLLVLWKLPNKTKDTDESAIETPLSEKFKRVDVLGAIVLACTISSFLLILESTAEDRPWWYTLIVGITFTIFAIFFYFVEKRWAKEPILPIELITKRPAITAYLLVGLQIAAQFSLFYAVPVYFQIVSGTTVADAGLRLVPTVIGNATGGLSSGFIIAKTGRYKLLTISASIIATIGYVLVLARWRGNTSWAEVTYSIPGGFGMGIIQSTMFIHLAASLDMTELAIAGTTLYLAQNIFMLVGIQVSTTVLRAQLRPNLEAKLDGVANKSEIIDQVVSNVQSIWRLVPEIRILVIDAYVKSLSGTFATSIVFALAGLVVGLTLRERKL